MGVTEVEEEVSTCVVTTTIGRCCTCATNDISLQNTVVTVGATSVMVPMVRTCISMCLAVRWSITLRRVSMCVM